MPRKTISKKFKLKVEIRTWDVSIISSCFNGDSASSMKIWQEKEPQPVAEYDILIWSQVIGNRIPNGNSVRAGILQGGW